MVAGYAVEAAIAFNSTCADKGVQSRYNNIVEQREALGHLECSTEVHYQLAFVPETTAPRQAYLWLYNVFSLIGDHANVTITKHNNVNGKVLRLSRDLRTARDI